MKRNYGKYIDKNQTAGDCQLVTAVNAYYFLTGKQWCKAKSDEYERLVDLTACRHGSAIHIEKAWNELGIEIVWEGNIWFNVEEILKKRRLPVEWNIWAWGYGFHSTLIVDYVKKSENIRVTNFRKVVLPSGWMSCYDMHKYENFSVQRDLKLFRIFALKGDPRNRTLKKEWKKEKKRWCEMHINLYRDMLKKI